MYFAIRRTLWFPFTISTTSQNSLKVRAISKPSSNSSLMQKEPYKMARRNRTRWRAGTVQDGVQEPYKMACRNRTRWRAGTVQDGAQSRPEQPPTHEAVAKLLPPPLVTRSTKLHCLSSAYSTKCSRHKASTKDSVSTVTARDEGQTKRETVNVSARTKSPGQERDGECVLSQINPAQERVKMAERVVPFCSDHRMLSLTSPTLQSGSAITSPKPIVLSGHGFTATLDAHQEDLTWVVSVVVSGSGRRSLYLI
uniref:uncharacterized protein isoform X2 n=1 Tax=Myxine glutinosa TaxID=7769 RepID=UPI00358E096E